jgi:hypothetical protein
MVVMILLTITVVFLLVYLLSCGLGHCIKSAIENRDRHILGVDITIEHIKADPFSGHVEAQNLIVHNPDGYESDFLLKVDKVFFDLDFWALIKTTVRSWFVARQVQIIIDSLELNSVHAIVEKHSLRTSNAKEVHEHLTNHKRAEKTVKRTKPEIALHNVIIQDIDVRFQVDIVMARTYDVVRGCDTAIADIVMEDVASEIGSTLLDDILVEIFKGILKPVTTHAAKKQQHNTAPTCMAGCSGQSPTKTAR